MWYDNIKIVVLNLQHREDRLLQFAEQAFKYEFPYERVDAIYDREQGARGLRDTITKLFNEEIIKETKHLLIFEDDCEMVESPLVFNQTMEKVVAQMPQDYHIIFLGCQITHRINQFYSDNLFPVQMAYSTHAWMLSLSGMAAILASDLQYPIDNHLTTTVQPMGKCYCVYPLLCSQFPGLSDIGGRQYMDWRPFIQTRYQQKIIEYKQGKR